MHRIMKDACIQEDSVEQVGATLHVMLPATNKGERTYDGIDWGAERIAAEASTFIHPNLYNVSNHPSTDFSGDR